MAANPGDEVPISDSIRNQLNQGDVKKAVGCGKVILTFLVAMTVLLAFVTPYTDWLWFVHDARQPMVFTLGYTARGTLFCISFAIGVAVFYLSLRQAFRLSAMYLRRPDSLSERLVSNAIEWFRNRGEFVAKVVALVFSFILAAGFSNNWMYFLMFKNGGTFGQKDPNYGMDLGFFVFELPFLRELASFSVWLMVLTTGLTLGVYVGLQALASLAKIELSRPQVRTHLNLLFGLLLVTAGIKIWLTRYEIGLIEGTQFTGGGAAAQFELGVRQVVAVAFGILGLLTLIRIKSAENYRFVGSGSAIVCLGYLLVGGMGGTIVQRVFVDPDRLDKERPYAERAIAMTRFAYGLDKIQVRDFAVSKGLTDKERVESAPTLESMRLWDPEVLRSALERLQSPKNYYAFNDVDIDRYVINGTRRSVMLSARDINLSGLDEAAQNWTNLRLRYTHGYGVAMSLVNEATVEGEPVLIGRDIPQILPPEIKLDQPRIYFSDTRDPFGQPIDDYALVNTKEEEFSYPTENGSATHRWAGNRGVPIGGPISRIAFSLALGDRTLLFAGNITSNSRLLVRRNVMDRARAIYPFLSLDRDPYIVLLGGKIIWVLDGYTTTDMIPYSARMEGGMRLNYIRNSVKITIDAYTGESTAFAIDAEEPLLKAYSKIYPGLIRPISELPKGLDQHFRYAEDLFKLQCAQLTQYHVTDPVSFLSNSEAWQLPIEQGLDRMRALMRPYYVTIQVPGSPEPEFMLILPFTPNGKPNMSGWLGAHCDPKKYGQLTLFRFSTGVPVDGPEVMETNFNSWPEVSNINRQYQNDQSEIVLGNLLVVPIGRNVLYAEPMFLRSKTAGLQARPRLFKVILSMDNRIVVGNTYNEALDKLFAPLGKGGGGTPNTDVKPVNEGPQEQRVRAALKLFDDADVALRRGDFAAFGALQKKGREELQAILRNQAALETPKTGGKMPN